MPRPVPFGGLNTGGQVCSVYISISSNPMIAPGRSISNGCTNDDVVQLQDTTLMLPIYDGGVERQSGYPIVAYAAFVLKGYRFTGQYKWKT